MAGAIARRALLPPAVTMAAGWALALGLIGVAFVVPLGLVIVRSFGDPFYQSYAAIAQSTATQTILLRTLRLGALVTLSTAVLGYPAAYGIARIPPRWRPLILGAIMLPFLSSYLVRTYGWIAILGQNGIAAGLEDALGWPRTSLVGTLPGLVIAMTHMLLPLMLMPVYTAMSTIDARQLSAASSMGAKPAEAFLRVYAPQTLPGVLAGTLLVFILSLGFFITPALIGGARETTLSQVIYMYINELFDWGRSSALAVGLLLVVAALLTAASRVANLGLIFGVKQPGAGTRTRHRVTRTGRFTTLITRLAAGVPLQRHGLILCWAVLALDLLVLLLPLVYVLLVSFQPLRLLALPKDGFSLHWYAVVLDKTEWYDATLNSLAVAAMATGIAFVIGLFLASQARRSSGVVRAVITLLALGPIALPTIVLALGLYAVFVQLGWTGNLAALAVAHAIVALPYVFINMANGLAGYDHSLDQAASSLGARPWTAFRRVKLPVLRTAIVTACVLAFLISFDELIITLFLAGPALPTLPVRMWAATSQNVSPELAVVGTLLTAAVLAAFGLIRLLDRRPKSEACQ